MKIVFNSSLPRSGSTLLQNILAQNPAFHCSATSGLLELLYGARSNFTTCPEFKAQDQKEMDLAFALFCSEGMQGFYRDHFEGGKSVIIDKSRGWMGYYDWLNSFWPDPKIIVCIRDLRAIFSSMEKLWRANPNRQAAGENPGKMEFLTVDARVGYWMQTPPIGLALARLADAIQRGNADKFHFVKFEELTFAQSCELPNIYHFIEEPYSSDMHSKVVAQMTTENDSIYGIPDLHTIRPVVEPVKEDWNDILGPELSKSIVLRYQWFYKRFYPEVLEESWKEAGEIMRRNLAGQPFLISPSAPDKAPATH